MKLWHWLALAAGGLFVLYMVTKRDETPTSKGTVVQPQTGYDWLRVSGKNFNVGLKL
jgi:hypothetical protein